MKRKTKRTLAAVVLFLSLVSTSRAPAQERVFTEMLQRAARMEKEGCPETAARIIRQLISRVAGAPTGDHAGDHLVEFRKRLTRYDPLTRSRASLAANLARTHLKLALKYEESGWKRLAAILRNRVLRLDPLVSPPVSSTPSMEVLFPGKRSRSTGGQWRIEPQRVVSPLTNRTPALLISTRSHGNDLDLQGEVKIEPQKQGTAGLIFAYKDDDHFYEVRIEHTYEKYTIEILEKQGDDHKLLTFLYTQRTPAQRAAWQPVRIRLSGDRIRATVGRVFPDVLMAEGKDLSGRFGLFAQTDHAPTQAVQFRGLRLARSSTMPLPTANEQLVSMAEAALKEERMEDAALQLSALLRRIPRNTKQREDRTRRRKALEWLASTDPFWKERSRLAQKAAREILNLARKYGKKQMFDTSLLLLDQVRTLQPGKAEKEQSTIRAKIAFPADPGQPLITQLNKGGQEFSIAGWTCREGIVNSPELKGKTAAKAFNTGLDGRFNVGLEVFLWDQEATGALMLATKSGMDFQQVRVTNMGRFRCFQIIEAKKPGSPIWQEVMYRKGPGEAGRWNPFRVKVRGSLLRTHVPGVVIMSHWFPGPEKLGGKIGLLAADSTDRNKPIRFRNLAIERY